LGHSHSAWVLVIRLGNMHRKPAGSSVVETRGSGRRAARDFLAASPAPLGPQVYNVTARANDLYDLAFETFAPRRHRRDRAVGRGLEDLPPGWIDLQLDSAAVTHWINARGIPLTPPAARLCHWSFYTREGALAVYQAILRRRPGWDVAALRAAPCLGVQEPRWSRLLPRREAARDDAIALDGRLDDA
jgi:hypothetical protein